MNSRSAVVSSGPDTPVMNARVVMGPISPRVAQGSRKRPLIPLDDALTAGRLQAAAELGGFIGRPEGADHGAVVDALVAEVGALDQGCSRSQHGRDLALQRLVGGLGVGLVALRGDLHQVSAAGSTAARDWGGLHGVGRRYPGSGVRGRGRLSALRRQ